MPQGKIAVVTGGAGGIGEAICRSLANAGISVVVGYNRSATEARALAASLPEVGAPHIALPAPITDSTAMKALAADVFARYQRCDVLVNCAGLTKFVAHTDLDGLDDTLIDQILSTNVRGTFAAVRAFAPFIEKTKNGVIINISSIAATTAMGSNIIHCASKAAVDNMTKSLARALAPNIHVISVSPGLVDTDFSKSIEKSWKDEQESKTPMRRLAMPEEVGEAVVAAIHLNFTTGTVIAVDGGRPLT